MYLDSGEDEKRKDESQKGLGNI